jgi:hypothetical protein
VLRRSLDSLRHELEPEGVPEADDSAQKGERVLARVDVRGEAPVDLHDVDRQRLQVRERGVPRPEVVERQRHAALLQSSELLLDAVDGGDQDALGELERQEVRRQP